MRKTLMLAALMMFSMLAHAQYFCSAEGTKLHYVNYDDAGQSVSNETTTVTRAVRANQQLNVQYITKIVTNKTKNNTSYSLTEWSYDGKKTVCTPDLMYGYYIADDRDPEKYDNVARTAMMEVKKFKGDNSFELLDGAKAGDAMPKRYYQYLKGMVTNEINITGAVYQGVENVSTTGGRFDCLKISYNMRSKVVLKTRNYRVTEWYAKGVGLVKSETYTLEGQLAGKTVLTKIVR